MLIERQCLKIFEQAYVFHLELTVVDVIELMGPIRVIITDDVINKPSNKCIG